MSTSTSLPFILQLNQLNNRQGELQDVKRKAGSRVTWGWIILILSLAIMGFGILSLIGSSLPSTQSSTATIGFEVLCTGLFFATGIVGVILMISGYSGRGEADRQLKDIQGQINNIQNTIMVEAAQQKSSS